MKYAEEEIPLLVIAGEETYAIHGIAEGLDTGSSVEVTARAADGSETSFRALARLDTSVELEYYRHGGILPYVLRQLRQAS
jgi:aconitate hydratase